MATVTVKIPTSLRNLTNGEDKVEAAGGDVLAVLDDLNARYPGLKDKICDADNKLRRFINVYANQDDIRFLDNLGTQLSDGDEVTIIPAIAGGWC